MARAHEQARLWKPANRASQMRAIDRKHLELPLVHAAHPAWNIRSFPIRWVRGRMPEALVSQAKKRTGIQSDTDLIEVALANIAVGDDYAEWLLSRQGTVDPEVDLEF